jgi:CrcB protein
MTLLMIFLGGGAGAVSRHALSSFVMKQAGGGFPWGTLAVNLCGAFAMGIIIGLLSTKITLPEPARLLLITGFLGGFTTFSAFSLEAALLLQKGDYLPLVAYVAASVIGTIALLILGMKLTA